MNVLTAELRSRFAAALSRMCGNEVPAYRTLVEVSTEVNRDHPGNPALGSIERVTAERHGAIRVGSPRELADVADLFAAFGMYPVGYHRGGDPTKPVVYEDFLPISAAGIFRSNLDSESTPVDAEDRSGYSADRLAGVIEQHVHDPYDLYEKAAAQ